MAAITGFRWDCSCEYVTPILKAPSVIPSYFRPLHMAFRSQSIAFLSSLISYLLPASYFIFHQHCCLWFPVSCSFLASWLCSHALPRPLPTPLPHHLSSTLFLSLSSRTQETLLVSYPYPKTRVRTLTSVLLAYPECTFISYCNHHILL